MTMIMSENIASFASSSNKKSRPRAGRLFRIKVFIEQTLMEDRARELAQCPTMGYQMCSPLHQYL